jgi:acyl carrier protein
MDTRIADDIIMICSKVSGIYANKITLDSSINYDLKIDGDDIIEIINQLDNKYGLNTNNFNYSKYFDDEGDANIIRSFLRFKPKKIEYDVKIKDLYNWVVNKEWKEEKVF